jgi:WD40 repeat protein/energy-coupling factor transporter ATP-binding protein EcfA2
MPRPERPVDPAEGPVQRLAAGLRELRRAAGSPGYRELAARTAYSATTLSDAARGHRLPALAVVKDYVRACGGAPAEWEERWRAVAAELSAERGGSGDGEAGPVPYLGLASFQAEDADRFFGRERLVRELSRRLSGGGFLMIVGASGCGKSSLLRAGLLPALVKEESPGSAPARSYLFTPGTRPLHELSSRLSGTEPAGAIIAVDQFEELFTACRDETQRERFVEVLLDAAARPRSTMVAALRADFYAHCAAYPRLLAALRKDTLLVGPMNDQELTRAVTGPANLAGLSVERALVTKLLADARGQAGALPLVSHALLETWRLRQGNLLTLAGYEAAGGVVGAIARTAERVYDELDETERRLARQILTRLTALGEGTEDTRRRVHRSELGFGSADVVIDRLVQARLLVVGGDTVEIAHEALIGSWPRLRRWLTEDRDALRTHRQLTDAAAIWADLGRDAGALYRGARLTLAREWAGRDRNAEALTDTERAFLAASTRAETAERAAVERRSRQLRVLSAGLAALLVVAVAVGAAGLWQWREAAGQREQALSRQLAAQALAAAPTDTAEAMRLSLAAYRAAPTEQARSSVLSLASRRAYSSRLPHGGLVRDVTFSPDGSTLAVAAQDGHVTLWDAVRRTQMAVLAGHAGAARAVAYSPGGTSLASGGLDGTVIVWDTGRRVPTARLRGHRGAVDAIAYSPDGSLLASIGEDHTVRLWRAGDGTLLGRLPGHGGTAADVAFSPDSRRLVSAGDDGTAVVWDVATRTRLRVLRGDPGELYAAAFSPDGRRIATAGKDGDILIWDAMSGERVSVLDGHIHSVRALAFAPGGDTLVSAGYDEVALVWDVARGQRIGRLTGHTSQLYGIAVSPDGRSIASASRDHTARLWDLEQLPLMGHAAEVLDVSVSPDGRTVASAASDGTSVLWDSTIRRPRAVLTERAPGTTPPVAPGGPGPARQPVLTRSGKTAILWDASTARPVRTFTGHTDRVLTVALQPGGRLLATGAADRTVRLWDAGSGAQLALFRQPGPVQRVAFTGDGRTLVAAAQNGAVSFWDTSTRSARAVIHTGARVADAAVTADGKLLAAGGTRGEISLWDTGRATLVGTMTGHTGPVDALAFSPDGSLLASGSQDRTVTLWHVPDRRAWATLVGHETGVSSAAWSSTGDRLYTGGVDRTVIPWTVRPAQALAALCLGLAVHAPSSPDGECQKTAAAQRSDG